MSTRQKAYHRQEHRAAHLRAIAALSARHWTDERTAAALTLLDAQAITALEAGGWEDDAIDAALAEALACPTSTRLPWTTMQVRYYRRRHLKRRRTRPSIDVLLEARQRRWRQVQAREGWTYLLPAYDEDAGEWGEGVELPPRAVQVLSLLRDRGPLASGQIAEALALPSRRSLERHSGRGGLLGWLRRLGLLLVDRMRRYLLAPELLAG